MRLLSRRIAERNAETGEHYIAGTRAQYREMLAISAGGGAVMAIAVYLKFAIAAAQLPPFWDGFVASLNYAGVFVLIALAHFTVATKQPAMDRTVLGGVVLPQYFHRDGSLTGNDLRIVERMHEGEFFLRLQLDGSGIGVGVRVAMQEHLGAA